jgi:arylformamidase
MEQPLSRLDVFRGLSQAERDAAYNNGAAVGDSAQWRARWQEEGAAIRASRCNHPDLRYGSGERTSIDLYLADGAERTLVFIHGGYWFMNSKEIFGFMTPGPLSIGLNVALIGYTLAPEAGITRIVGEIRQAMDWLKTNLSQFGCDPGQLVVGGWSAGGHLAASAMIAGDVPHGLSISGVFDLEPIRHTYINEKLSMTPQEAALNSPNRHLPKKAGRFLICAGGDELPDLRRQSVDFAKEWTRAGLSATQVEIPGLHHFAMMEELARPGGKVLTLLSEFLAR